MAKRKKRLQLLLVIMAILFGFAIRVYVWDQFTNPVVAGEEDGNTQGTMENDDKGNSGTQEQGSNDSTTGTTEDPQPNNIGNDATGDTRNNPNLGLIVKKYVAHSEDGPWTKVTRAKVDEEIYWRILIENTGEFELTLTYFDISSHGEIQLSDLLGVFTPPIISPGEIVEVVYSTMAEKGKYENMIKVTGSYEDNKIEDTDRAYYLCDYISVSKEPKTSEEPPQFVVPEFPLGSLGGLLSIVVAFTLIILKKEPSIHAL